MMYAKNFLKEYGLDKLCVWRKLNIPTFICYTCFYVLLVVKPKQNTVNQKE